jgi:hypothetical protein
MAVRLEHIDEYMHELGPEPNFNESMYFNLYDPSNRIGGFFRLGNRANEGYAEMTVCLYLPDGRVGFMFGRPTISSNDAFDAGGLTFGVVRPFEELVVRHRGDVVMLDDALEMADPRRAFTENPRQSASADLTYTAVSTMFGGEPETPHESASEEFARGHYEQLVAATGRIAVGEESWEVSGYGLRDHSWGPRYWQAPWYYRWLTANFGPTFGFMGSRIARRQGPGTRGGFVWDGTSMVMCDHLELATTWQGEESYHRDLEVVLGSGDRRWKVHGQVLSLIPLRNRRDGLVTRISEGLTRWTLDDGRVGYGLSEYLDQMVDDRPVGIAE